MLLTGSLEEMLQAMVYNVSQCTRSTMVSHVVLILSETNPIICAVSEPNTEKTSGWVLFGVLLSPSQGNVPGAPRLLYHANLRAQMGRLEGSGFIRARCADRVLAVEEKKKKCSRLWSQIWACRCVTGGVDPLWYQTAVLCKGFGGRREASRGQG